MRLDAITVYPVKSTRGLSRQEAVVQPWGLTDDRRWMVVDAEGSLVTARKHPELLGVVATPGQPGTIRLQGSHAEPLEVDARSRRGLVPVRVWRSHLDATHVGPQAGAWFAKLLGQDVRLVWLDDPTRRPVDPEYGRPEDRVCFADGYPLLVANTASLRQVDAWAAEDAALRDEAAPGPLDMRRFRPSIVVDTDDPFAEDHWRRIRVGAVEFRAVKPCDRCVLTTIDPDTLAKGKEPLRTLARHRRRDSKVLFGINLIPDGTGTIRVGDPVTVLSG
ncbi:MAG: MOSC domain-containing protein [Jiangellaceae bacterium]